MRRNKMSYLKTIEQDIIKAINNIGYEVDKIDLTVSNRPDLGDYQINDAMKLAKAYHKNPREIAESIKTELEKDYRFENINIAGPGFINLSISNKALIEFLNELNEDVKKNLDSKGKKKVLIDYGGANIAKTLHVGHLRSANIGEALKRLAKALDNEVIADVHFGDIGRQSGMVISEIKRLHPELPYFQEGYNGEEVDFTITAEELGEIYPRASTAAKENEERMEEVRQITAELEEGHKGYMALWTKVKNVSMEDIKQIYIKLNTDFDLWEGELDCYPHIPATMELLKDYLYESEGALVIDVAEETDNSPMPPLVVIKSNGATLYATRELATIYSRIKRFELDEMWYVTDFRQGLYFEQVFRASKKSGLVKPELEFKHLGFGTMNGPDGKPFKTRDGGVMDLKSLIDLILVETTARLNPNITDEKERKEIAETIAIAALKYADFLPFRTTDYIFEPSKFSDLEGKTGPYLLYSTIRMKSLLNKAETKEFDVKVLENKTDREIAITLLNLPEVIDKAYEVKSLNDIADFLYKLTSVYNKFYAENRILTEEDQDKKESWLTLTKIVKQTNEMLLDILGIEVPERM
ncbi:MAG: arginine--tRNA ligase [Firmicutes bacterium]|nr:arginine--tRNA ligase [Bacillota bacterium]